jgi:circadian clock protein KaiB
MCDDSDNLTNSADDFEKLASAASESRHVLRLYISGMTSRSTEALNNIRAICEAYLKGRYELEVVDVYKHPESTRIDQIIATPTLIKQLPLPLRRLVGTLSDEERVLIGLDLIKKA